MRKKFLAVMAAVSLLAVSLAGCGNSGKTEEPANNSAGESADSDQSELASGESGEFAYPMKTDETLVYWANLGTNVSANYSNLGDTPFGKAWMEKTGVKIEFQHPPAGQEKEQFSLIIADGSLPDLMEYSWMSYPGGPEKAIKDGNIIPLNEIFEKYCPNLTAYLKANPDIDKMVKTDDGNYYLFPFIRGDDILCRTIGPMLREDWLTELNLEVPTTIDEWYTVLKAFKEQKGARAPLSFEYTMESLVNSNPFAYAFNTCREFYTGKDGKVHFGPVEEGYKQYLTTFSQWYKEGLIDPDLATLALDQVSAKMTNGDAGASFGWAGSRMGVWVTAAIASNPDYKLKAAPFPTLEKGAYPEMGQIESKYSNQGGVAITTKCKNVELAARLMDYAYGEEGHMLFNFGIEGESYTMVDGYPAYTDLVLNNPDGLSVAQALSAYVRGNYNGPFVQDKRYLEQYYTIDSQKETNAIWGATNAEQYKVPPITPTADESKEFSTIMNEINTYRDEMTLKFLFGTESLDNFDNYVKTIQNMGLDRALEIQNTALERYNAR